MNKKGQLAIIIILALVITGVVVTYFVVKGNISHGGVSTEFKPVYEAYSSCIRDKTAAALEIAGSQGGRIYLKPFIPGSEYAPFSSRLNFMGIGVPYWFYVAGNGVVKENIPTKREIENEVAEYVREKIPDCNFESLYRQGFSIKFGEPSVTVDIRDKEVEVNVNSMVSASKENDSAVKKEYDVILKSKFGEFYNTAREIYNKEKNNAFLEKYGVDVLNSYAPVDGVEIECSPKVWQTREVVSKLKDGLEANIGAIKMDGDYYTLGSKKDEYFVVDQKVDDSVNLIYSKNWPTKVEISGSSGELMIADPVGNKEGLGVMGFCYAPYHFVYDVSFPVMIQIYDAEEMFQFPVVAIIDNNLPREGIAGTVRPEEEFDVCQFKTQDIEIRTYDNKLNPMDANISYTCFDSECTLGESKDGTFVGKAPACVNGYLRARAKGFADKKIIFSSNEEVSADIIMDREYNTTLDLKVGGQMLKGNAVVLFEGNQVVSAMLPDSPNIKLTEGLYNVTVYVYGNSSIVIPATTKRECTTVSKGGLAGLFGMTEEKCFNINIPSTKIDYALVGGGRSSVYLLPSDLDDGNLKLSVDSLPVPSSIDALANNYELFNVKGVEIE